jgi:hypothetical protein
VLRTANLPPQGKVKILRALFQINIINQTTNHGNHTMYQPNLPHLIAKSALPHTMQDYSAALTNAGSFLREIEKAHANPLPGDPLAKTTFSE